MKQNLSFILALLAAVCADNIPLALGLTLAAVLTMALPQILNRLGIWAEKESRSRCCEHQERQSGKPNAKDLSIPILRDLKEKCKYEKYDV